MKTHRATGAPTGRHALRTRRGRRFAGGLGWLGALLVPAIQVAAQVAESVPDLAELSLEDLMNVEISSVSKRTEHRFDAAASVTVISQEEIRRSGLLSVPELLRGVPGVQVAQLSANRWAISSRGLNEEFAPNLLVLLDGRSLYTPFFGGVYWDVQDYPLEDIERIEVIRGSGGTIWGENAVNGVINIITKNAAETQGALLSGQGGTQTYGKTIRYGGRVGEKVHYRVFGKGFRSADFDSNKERRAHDGWHQWRAGLRIDSNPTDADEIRLSGEYYDQETRNNSATATPGVFAELEREARGWHVLSAWKHRFSEASMLSLQAYYDHTRRGGSGTFEERRDTVDLELQHDLSIRSAVNVSWGGSFRYSASHSAPASLSAVDPNRANFYVGSGFIQGASPFFDDRLTLTLGTKLGYNNWSGLEVQPSFRWLAKPADNHVLWGAVSRAVRLPTQVDRDVSVVIGLPLRGSNGVRSTDLTSFELGYRAGLFERATAELSLFYNLYEDVRAFAVRSGAARFVSEGRLATRGLEFELKTDVVDGWRLTFGYSYFDVDSDLPSRFFLFTEAKGASPDHQFVVRNAFELGDQIDLDAALFYVDGLSGLVPAGQAENVENYFRFDLRLAYRPWDGLELSLAGQNLTDRRHFEFSDVRGAQASQVPRSVYGAARIEF